MPGSRLASAPRWLIPVLVSGLVLIGAGIWAGARLACKPEPARRPAALAQLGEPCGGDAGGAMRVSESRGGDPAGSARGAGRSPVGSCDKGLICAPGVQRCLRVKRPASSQCSPSQGKACGCGGTIQCNGGCSARACSGSCKSGRCCTFSTDPACGGASPPARRADFNGYILRAVDLLYQGYRGRGYDINSAFTHDLDYSLPGEIKAAPHPPTTMCVAAVSEVIIAALKLYADETHDRAVFDKLPGRSWMKGTPLDIRPYMFLYSNVESSGTADALTHFGIGERRPFTALVPGDFVGLNRANGSGHAVVFMGYLNDKGQLEPRYDSAKVVGFKYFSAQGKNPPDAGLGYRWAFFGACPGWKEAGKPRDCGIVASDNPKLLNTGYMLQPAQWAAAPAMRTLKAALVKRQRLQILAQRLRRPPTVSDLSRLSPGESRQLEAEATRRLTVELPPVSRLEFDGTTTDD